MINLLEETVRILTIYNKTWNDISWIGGDTFYIDVEQFITAAKNINYNCGYGHIEVARDLVICFKDGSWLFRAEYDGSECWKYNKCPQKPQEKFEGEVKLADLDGYDARLGLKGLNR